MGRLWDDNFWWCVIYLCCFQVCYKLEGLLLDLLFVLALETDIDEKICTEDVCFAAVTLAALV